MNVLPFADKEGAGKQYQHADADAGVGQVENPERPEGAEMQVGIVDDIAEPHAVDDVAERAAKDAGGKVRKHILPVLGDKLVADLKSKAKIDEK